MPAICLLIHKVHGAQKRILFEHLPSLKVMEWAKCGAHFHFYSLLLANLFKLAHQRKKSTNIHVIVMPSISRRAIFHAYVYSD